MSSEIDRLKADNERLKYENKRMKRILNTPLIQDFVEAVIGEAQHQYYHWSEDHDASKNPPDWFWTLGYLAGKAQAAHLAGDVDKALHHTVSSAALLYHWHQHIKEQFGLETEHYGTHFQRFSGS